MFWTFRLNHFDHPIFVNHSEPIRYIYSWEAQKIKLKGSSILRPFLKVEAELYVQALRLFQTSLNVRITRKNQLTNEKWNCGNLVDFIEML